MCNAFGKSYSRSSKNYYGSYAVITFNDSATLLLFGPIGIYLGDGVNWLYYYIMNLSPILLGGFIGGIWCVLVILGLTVGLCQLGLMMSLEQDGKIC